MGKHTKLPAATTAPQPDPDSDALSPLAGIESDLRVAFESCMTAIRSGSFAPQILRELSGLSRAITQVQAERRAQTKARRFVASNLPPELVLEHLRLLTSERRGHIVNELIRMDDESSVLG